MLKELEISNTPEEVVEDNSAELAMQERIKDKELQSKEKLVNKELVLKEKIAMKQEETKEKIARLRPKPAKK